MGFRVRGLGLGFKVWVLGLGSGLKVWGLGFRFWDLGFKFWGLEFGVQGMQREETLPHIRCLIPAEVHYIGDP